jgi:hypothetical protein
MPGLNAIPAAWTSLMGPVFETVKAPFFRKQTEPARACFCEKCYCAHEVVTLSPAPSVLSPLVAVCQCESGSCPDISLTPADIEIWELSWPRLGRALCRALQLDARSDELPVCNTRQIGSWSADAVPVFLTIQTEPEDLRGVIAELVARLQHPFILLAPTAAHLNATCRELLTHAKASFFPLDSTVCFTEHATLRSAKPPGELFASLCPAVQASAVRGSTVPRSSRFAYALAWEPAGCILTFEGSQTTLEHGVALLHVAYLLTHPGVPVPAAQLAARTQVRRGRRGGLTGIPNPDGGFVLLEAGSIIEEPPVKIGDSRVLRELRRQHAELAAVLESEQASEPEKAEAQRDLERNEKLQHQYLGRFRDTAQKAARAVRKSIYRLLNTLRAPPRGQRAPHPLQLRFADHLEQYLIVPSRRYSGHRARITRADLAGCLSYEPPSGIVWVGTPTPWH